MFSPIQASTCRQAWSYIGPRLHLLFGIVLFSLLLFISGCASEKESLHEHDHEVPAHWPSDLNQAAERIDGRILALQTSELSAESRSSMTSELKDLIEWAPEVAADTDLAETDWIPIYELSEAIRGHMETGDVNPNEFASDFSRLSTLLREAHTSLNVQDSSATSPMDSETSGQF